MKFLVDTNLGRKFTRLLQESGHDAVFAKMKGALGKARGKFIVIEEGRVRIRRLG